MLAKARHLFSKMKSTPMQVDVPAVSVSEVEDMQVDGADDSVPVQVLSDLHLEFTWRYSEPGSGVLKQAQGYHVYEFPVSAPNLALLGDIGLIADGEKGFFAWLRHQLERFQRVFFLLGNHEFYRLSYDDARKKVHAFAREAEEARTARGGQLGEFILLDRTRYDLSPTLTILGCTFWSNIPPPAESVITLGLSDMTQIRGGWDCSKHNAAHRREVAWLADTLARIRKHEPHRRVAVMTHHAPTTPGTSLPKYEGDPNNLVQHAFVTQMAGTVVWGKPVIAWAFGHTHYSCDFVRDGVRVVSNQRGYEYAKAERGIFDEEKVLLL